MDNTSNFATSQNYYKYHKRWIIVSDKWLQGKRGLEMLSWDNPVLWKAT